MLSFGEQQTKYFMMASNQNNCKNFFLYEKVFVIHVEENVNFPRNFFAKLNLNICRNKIKKDHDFISVLRNFRES